MGKTSGPCRTEFSDVGFDLWLGRQEGGGVAQPASRDPHIGLGRVVELWWTAPIIASASDYHKYKITYGPLKYYSAEGMDLDLFS